MGIVFATDWYANEMLKHAQEHILMFITSYICFSLAGLFFGLALTSMLWAGILSIITKKVIEPLPE